jgi:hypothetical protein
MKNKIFEYYKQDITAMIYIIDLLKNLSSESSELLGVWTLSIVWRSKKHNTTQRYGIWVCFLPQVRSGRRLLHWARYEELTSITF